MNTSKAFRLVIPSVASLSIALSEKSTSTQTWLFVQPPSSRCESSQPQSCAQQNFPSVATSAPAPAPSWIRRYLSAIYLTSLPLPRRLTRGDPAFQDSLLKQGIRQRQQDEQKLRSLQAEIQKAQQKRDSEEIRRLFDRVTEIAFGKGVTPQLREDFVARYGCTGWTTAILEKMLQLAKSRGIVELGAGHGQWSLALTTHYDKLVQDKVRSFDFCLAYDDMSELPLSTKVYHKHTQPAHDYFFPKVQKCSDAISVFRQWTTRGRVLLIVYPPPGSMALETIKAYVQMGPENDTVVYVGEGRGGSTANEALFDYLENGDWELVEVMDVKTQPGGKGYEKLFILKRLKISTLA